MAVGKSLLYIWKAILSQAITFYYLYHQNNGRVNNIFVYNTDTEITVIHNNRVFKHALLLDNSVEKIRTVGQSSIYIWNAIVTSSITFHYLHHQNNGRVHNIFVQNPEIMVVHNNNRVFNHYCWITILKKHQNCWIIILIHLKTIVTLSITAHYLYHQNNGRVHNIFLHKMQR